MFIDWFLKNGSQFVEILDLNVGFAPEKVAVHILAVINTLHTPAKANTLSRHVKKVKKKPICLYLLRKCNRFFHFHS